MTLTSKDRIFLLVQLLAGLGYIVFGLYLIFDFTSVWEYVSMGIQIVVGLSLLIFLYRFFTEKTIGDLLNALGAIALLISMWINAEGLLSIISLFFGLWALFNSASHALDIYITVMSGKQFPIMRFLLMLFGLILGVIFFVTYNNSDVGIVQIQIGFYILLLGSTHVISSLRVLFRHKSILHLPAPVFISALIPTFEVRRIKRIKKYNPDIITKEIIPTGQNQVSIYIYSMDSGFDSMGHMAIGYKGIMYSYGNHDPYHRHPSLLVGEGVMIVGKEVDILDFDRSRGMTIFQFVCEIDEEQCHYIENQLTKLFSTALRWRYPIEKDPDNRHYLSWMINYGCKNNTYYKFTEGPFKTYSALTTNCVLITDYIFESIGMRFFQISGIITSGAYYDYLNGVLNKPGSIVKEKHIYQSE